MTMAGKIFTAALAAIGLAASGAELAPGSTAPAFTALNEKGKLVSLADYAGKSLVVLYFYPKDETPGCTAEACSLRDGFVDIQKTGAIILGVSADDVKSHAAFQEHHQLPFQLLADPEAKIIEAYGVKMPLPLVKMAKRVTFIIDQKGIIRDIFRDVKPATHNLQVLEALKKIKP